jgi:HAE1 family hydrophobic/amphiphilic exporter-1
MAFLTDTSLRRPVAMTIVFLIVITLGVIGLRRLPVDLLPRIDFPRLSVNVSYADVGPQEMERSLPTRSRMPCPVSRISSA